MAKIKTIHTLGNDYDIYDASAIHDVDSVLNETSINPVENQVVTSALNTKSEVGHDHNDAYYTKDEADTILTEAQKFAPTVNSTTANYQLSQWASTDRILMADFNSDNAKIDTALSALAEAVAAKADGAAVTALAEAVNGKGNCEIELTTYTGTGEVGPTPTVIQFPKMPLMFFVWGGTALMVAKGGDDYGVICGEGTSTGVVQRMHLTWSGNQCSFYHTAYARLQMNAASTTYHVLAVYQTDAA